MGKGGSGDQQGMWWGLEQREPKTCTDGVRTPCRDTAGTRRRPLTQVVGRPALRSPASPPRTDTRLFAF